MPSFRFRVEFRRFAVKALTFAVVVSAAVSAWALGEGLGETKEQLKLQYDVSLTHHGTGRVTVNLTIVDDGRLKPLDSVDLVIPSQDKTGYVDLSVPLAVRETEGKRIIRAHLKKEWAERGEIQLKTSTLDGKKSPLTWYYHSIPLGKFLKNKPEKAH